MKKKPSCYLLDVAPHEKRRVMAFYILNRSVVRVTDHGPHIKIIVRGKCPTMRATMKPVLVPDKTTHWDVQYWSFAMTIARRALTKKQPPHDAIGVLNHYLCNLFCIPEPLLMDFLAAGNRYIQASTTDEEAHGWELRALGRKKK